MNQKRERRRDVAKAIFADEIGLQFGIYGEFRLWSAYQPIFAPEGRVLRAVAVEGLIEPRRVAEPVATSNFFGGISASDRLFVETMCRMLHLGNYRNIGVEGLTLFFNYNPMINDHLGRALAEIRLTEQAADDRVLVSLVREMRRDGIRIAIDDFGTGHSTEARINLLAPDIVKIDGAWFAELCRHAAAERFFRPLVGMLHERGAKVLVEGIEHAQHLRVALGGGVDLLQGFHLARPALAGTVFKEEPLSVDDLLDAANKVLPLHKQP